MDEKSIVTTFFIEMCILAKLQATAVLITFPYAWICFWALYSIDLLSSPATILHCVNYYRFQISLHFRVSNLFLVLFSPM